VHTATSPSPHDSNATTDPAYLVHTEDEELLLLREPRHMSMRLAAVHDGTLPLTKSYISQSPSNTPPLQCASCQSNVKPPPGDHASFVGEIGADAEAAGVGEVDGEDVYAGEDCDEDKRVLMVAEQAIMVKQRVQWRDRGGGIGTVVI